MLETAERILSREKEPTGIGNTKKGVSEDIFFTLMIQDLVMILEGDLSNIEPLDNYSLDDLVKLDRYIERNSINAVFIPKGSGEVTKITGRHILNLIELLKKPLKNEEI